ncbi:aldehyde dehydrogenase (NADP(+)) [Segetibacter sp. 3557_3]|uniref:aldehyde dehydrogenase (NADP(+)) n=1 Tax=Segetibacter sp. 3557_3 TaxID=2547429 RepID=UPI001058B053|nr:aldehyde dehydrogenase (NADP(+)) [Segetibacter sp. 3557_3]TDH23485.1 aldehyde dehydrogenase (NADP(+)) [Segetibacter sp. 3557_3]
MINTLTGVNFTGFTTSAESKKTFQAFSPASNNFLEDKFSYATESELKYVLELADRAFPVYRDLPALRRAEFLDAIADEIMALGDALIQRCSTETALPAARITGERGRTCNQLKMFAQLLRDGWWVDARIDTAQPDRQPLPKPDVRRMHIPIGPVAVFGASNFPLAFSTAGGDTASALAAGCPVVVKAHSSHPGTNELVSSAIIKAAKTTGMPEGVFSSVYLSHDDVVTLVQHRAIKAVGFTGSRDVGMLLFKAANGRLDPIPVYAEMSAVNPVILMEGALQTKGEKIAKDLAGSITMGVGQFCTNPGLVLAIESDTTKKFLELLAGEITSTLPASMLNRNIAKAYNEGVKKRQDKADVLATAAREPNKDKYEAGAVVHTIDAEGFSAARELSEEIFGPASLVVMCKDETALISVLQSLEGQLTATIHATEADEQSLAPMISIITHKAGRVIYGGYPTGVEVCHSMQHGGPFPSTTDGRSTSVGTAAIYRFVRPVAYQDFPNHLLPEALRNDNPSNILRLVNNEWTNKPIAGQ